MGDSFNGFQIYTTKWMYESKLYDEDCEGCKKKSAQGKRFWRMLIQTTIHP
jgi:hypothetical protein